MKAIRGFIFGGIILLVIGTIAYGATWTGALGETENEWFRGGNWGEGAPPDNPYDGTVTFTNDGLNVANAVVPAEGTLWDVFNLNLKHETLQAKHIFELSGNTLLIRNQLRHGGMWSGKGYTDFKNGVLQVGTPLVAGEMIFDAGLGHHLDGPEHKIYPSVTFAPYIHTLRLGLLNHFMPMGGQLLDIRGVQLAPEFNATLDVNNLMLTTSDQILIDNDTGIDQIIVRQMFTLEYSDNYPSSNPDKSIAYIGDPGQGRKLPARVSLQLGDENQRANVYMSTKVESHSGGREAVGANSELFMQGGDFWASLDTLAICHPLAPVRDRETVDRWHLLYATLDLSDVGEFFLDANNLYMSISHEEPSDATFILPAGTATFGDVLMCHDDEQWPLAVPEALVTLNGTRMEVRNSLTMHKGAEIVVNVAAAAAGVDLASGATLHVGENASIHINFTQPLAAGEWGMRWGGDKVDDIEALVDAGRITWNDDALGDKDAVVFFQNGFTHIGVTGVRITQFALTGNTGSSLFTISNQVAVDLQADSTEGTVDGWMITETDTQPGLEDDWSETAPDVYAIQGAQGMITLYAWVKDSVGNIAGRSASILYEPNEPGISNVVLTDNGDETVTVTWDTVVPAYGKIDYRLYWDPDWISTPFVGPATSHSAVMQVYGLPDEQHLIVITSNAATYDTEWPPPSQVYPEGDVNEDCIVDLFDLVFVRNRLFSEEPEDAAADVNENGNIDLDDLIIVRNNLGAVCEE